MGGTGKLGGASSAEEKVRPARDRTGGNVRWTAGEWVGKGGKKEGGFALMQLCINFAFALNSRACHRLLTAGRNKERAAE